MAQKPKNSRSQDPGRLLHFEGNATTTRKPVLQKTGCCVWRLRQKEGINFAFRYRWPKGWGWNIWGVESERDMYNYGAKRADAGTRAAGLTTSLVIIGGLAVAVATMKYVVPEKEEKGEVAIIEVEEVVEEPPPPPPPVDLDLPPPPPMVIVPQFEFDVPPPPAAITQVAPAVTKPAPAPPAPPAAKPAPPPPAVTIRKPPQIGRRFKEPEYPPGALRAKESGETRISVCVDAEGRMSNAKLVKSSGSQRLDDAAIKGINGNRMEPAVGTDGKPIAMCNPPWEFTYVWKLPER